MNNAKEKEENDQNHNTVKSFSYCVTHNKNEKYNSANTVVTRGNCIAG